MEGLLMAREIQQRGRVRQGCIPVKPLSQSPASEEEENSSGPTNASTVFFRDEVIVWNQLGSGG